MGHIMGHNGVKVDPKTIQVMQEWTHPNTLKTLSRILCLTGNYQMFVKNYRKNVGPLTSLKKNAYEWNDSFEKYFNNSNQAMCNTIVIAISNFTKTFVLECDALGTGLGAVLTQRVSLQHSQVSNYFIEIFGKSTYEK